jgi:cytochrome bd-type quinol oxidase subunit 2
LRSENGYALDRRQEMTPLLGAIGLFLMSFIWIAISLWPMIVPFHYTLWQVGSSDSTRAFLGALFLLPIPHVFGLVVLGLPRQSAQLRRLTLTDKHA